VPVELMQLQTDNIDSVPAAAAVAVVEWIVVHDIVGRDRKQVGQLLEDVQLAGHVLQLESRIVAGLDGNQLVRMVEPDGRLVEMLVELDDKRAVQLVDGLLRGGHVELVVGVDSHRIADGCLGQIDG